MGILIDILLGLVFAGSAFTLWYKFSQKIPDLARIPDEVIVERLRNDSAKFRFFILHIKTFYKEQLYKDWFFNFLGKTLYKFHILILRFDNGTVGLLKKIKISNGVTNFFNGVREEPEELKERLPETDSGRTACVRIIPANDNRAAGGEEDRKKYWQKITSSNDGGLGKSNRVEEVRTGMNKARKPVRKIRQHSVESKNNESFSENMPW